MSASRTAWRRAQVHERRYHEQKDADAVMSINRVYWQRILAALPAQIAIRPGTRILDVGCGGAGILLAMDRGERTGIDPLMPFYLENFPFLAETPIQWVQGRAEDLEHDATHDLIFAINMLDHTEDPHRVAKNLARSLVPGGFLVCGLNVHSSPLWSLYFRLFHRLIDPPHPHHFLAREVPGLFPTLNLVQQTEIDDLWLDLREEYQQRVLGRPPTGWKQLLPKLANPLRYPLAAARLAGRPLHRTTIRDKPLMTTQLFVFTAPRPTG